jgi:hypothetical protein
LGATSTTDRIEKKYSSILGTCIQAPQRCTVSDPKLPEISKTQNGWRVKKAYPIAFLIQL